MPRTTKHHDIFSDRRVLVDRRLLTRENRESQLPKDSCVRSKQRRRSNQFHQRDWWLHANYVDYEEQV